MTEPTPDAIRNESGVHQDSPEGAPGVQRTAAERGYPPEPDRIAAIGFGDSKPETIGRTEQERERFTGLVGMSGQMRDEMGMDRIVDEAEDQAQPFSEEKSS